MAESISTFIRRFWTHIFVIATGFAALSHSTWTLSVVFGGPEPVQFSQTWWAWLIPGFLIAFSFDVGQVAISVELRNGERARAKYIAFAVLAVSTYLLQWWYLAHHFPLLALAEGLRADWKPFASLVSDAIVWVAPALLPLATTLYTAGYAKPKRVAQSTNRVQNSAKPVQNSAIAERTKERIALPDQPSLAALPEPSMTAMFIAKCDACGKEWPCESERARTNKLNAHKRFCPAKVVVDG